MARVDGLPLDLETGLGGVDGERPWMEEAYLKLWTMQTALLGGWIYSASVTFFLVIYYRQVLL